MVELLGCPFCGADAILHEIVDGVCTIACTQCGIAAMQSPTLNDAIWCWNTRAPNTRSPEWLEGQQRVREKPDHAVYEMHKGGEP